MQSVHVATIAFLEDLSRRGEKVHGDKASGAVERLKSAVELCSRVAKENGQRARHDHS